MVETSWVKSKRSCSAAQARTASSSAPLRPASWTRRMSTVGCLRRIARRISLLKFSSASQRNTSSCAALADDGECQAAATSIRSRVAFQRFSGAVAQSTVLGQSNGADNIQPLGRCRQGSPKDIVVQSLPPLLLHRRQSRCCQALTLYLGHECRRQRRLPEASVLWL